MDTGSVMLVAEQALWITMLVAAPILLTALGVGLAVGMVQAATQIQEMTLSFIPKLLAMGAVTLIAGPWMLQTLVEFTDGLYRSIPGLIG